MSTFFQSLINSQRSANMKNKNLYFLPQKIQTNSESPQIMTRNKETRQTIFILNPFFNGNLRSDKAFPYKCLNVADVNNV